MKNNTTGLLFLIGAGAGAVATYLLDPERGDARRAAIARGAHDALDYAGDAVGQTASAVGQTASQLADTSTRAGRRLSAFASDASTSAQETGADWLHRGQKQAERGKSLLSHWFEKEEPTVRARAQSLAQNLGSHFDRSHVGAPAVIGSSTATVLTGLGLYYFFGSSKGAERRAALAKKVHLAARETGELGRKTGAYLRDRVSGSADNDATVDSEPSMPQARNNPGYVGDAPESGEPTLNESRARI